MTRMVGPAALGVLLVSGACASPSPDGASGPGTTSTAPGATATAATEPATTETPPARPIQRTTVVITAPPGLTVATGVDTCTGSDAYADLAPGDVVRLVDGSGTLITTVPLGAGKPSGQANDCTWSAEVELPTDRGSYRALIEGWGSSGLLSLDDLYQPIVIEPVS